MNINARYHVLAALLVTGGCEDLADDTRSADALEWSDDAPDPRLEALAAAPEADAPDRSEGADAEAIDEFTSEPPPPTKGTCGGYWDHSSQYGACGSCWHTVPEPDRPGKLAQFYKRWCWTGGIGCDGCEPWIYTFSRCLDNC